MAYRKRTKRSRIVLVFAVIIISILAVLFMMNRSKSAQNTSKNAAVKNSKENITNSGDRSATLFEPLTTAEAYESLIESQSRATNEVVRITKLNLEEVNWNTQKVVPVKFFASSGQSIRRIDVDDSGFITATLLDAPSGCLYTAVQNKHLAFAVTSKDQKIESQDKIKIDLVANDAKCNR